MFDYFFNSLLSIEFKITISIKRHYSSMICHRTDQTKLEYEKKKKNIGRSEQLTKIEIQYRQKILIGAFLEEITEICVVFISCHLCAYNK